MKASFAEYTILRQPVLITTAKFLIWIKLYLPKMFAIMASLKITGLTESIAVIAIDKHSNESKVFIVHMEGNSWLNEK